MKISKGPRTIGLLKIQVNVEYAEFYKSNPTNKLYYPKPVVLLGKEVKERKMTKEESEEIEELRLMCTGNI